MSYKPNAVDQTQRESHYRVIWVGAACSIFTFANAFLGWGNVLTAIALGGTVGGVLSGILAHRTDDYFQSLANHGMRWAVSVVAAYLFVSFSLDLFDVAYSAGYSMTNAGGAPQRDTFALFATDARSLAAFAALAFYAGYAFAWMRDRMEAEEE